MTRKNKEAPQRIRSDAGRVPALGVDAGEAYMTEMLYAGGLRGPNLATRTRWRNEHMTLVHPQINGVNDAATVTLVLDALARMEHEHAFYAKDLTVLLNANYPTFLWDSVTVGKILQNIAATTVDLPLLPQPLQYARDYQGHYYWFTATTENWTWLLGARDAMGGYAKAQIAQEIRQRTSEPRSVFPDAPLLALLEAPKGVAA